MSFVIRTVRKGSVRIYGKDFCPDDSTFPYDGRLDGMRMAFGLYYVGSEMESFVSLWGTAEQYQSHDPEWEGDEPHLIDGTLHWMSWNAVGDPR